MTGPVSRPSRTSLPRPLSTFIGRQRDVARIATYLTDDGVRLLTLLGPGGVGKTRLAIEAASRAAAAFPDGTWFVDLSPLTDPSLVGTTIARVVGAADNNDAAVERLVAFLRDRRALLVLDNFEQVITAAGDLVHLLEHCPQLMLLVTSREPLGVAGEQHYPVPPLAIEAVKSAADGPPEAVQLFADRARARIPDFTLTNETLPILAEICRQLDGLPLAIELAAARVKILPLPALRSRLERRLPLLTGSSRDLPARHRTMRDTIAWSYELLGPNEQRLFRGLGAFVGGCSLEALEAVFGAGLDAEDTLIEQAAALVEHSLVRQEATTGDEPRILMLETIREYAVEQLEESGEADSVRGRHAQHFATTAETINQGFYSAEDRRGRMMWMAREMPNLRAAAAWALQNGRADLALRLGTATQSYVYFHGNPTEAQWWRDAALRAPGEADPGLRSDALWAAATLASLADLDLAAALSQEGIDVARSISDRLRMARSLHILGNTAEWACDFKRAVVLRQEGLDLLASCGDDSEVEAFRALFRLNLGDTYIWLGDSARGVPLIIQALEHWRRADIEWAIPFPLQSLAVIACEEGNLSRAAELYDEVLTRRLAFADRAGVAGVLNGVAGIELAKGDLERAALVLGAADAVRQQAGVRYGPHYVRGVQVLTAVEAKLDEQSLSQARAAGEALTEDDAIALARQLLADSMSRSTSTQGPGDSAAPATSLTPREAEVVQLVARGWSNQDIANALFISVPTVKRHLTNILGKLDLPSRSALNTWAHDHGLT